MGISESLVESVGHRSCVSNTALDLALVEKASATTASLAWTQPRPSSIAGESPRSDSRPAWLADGCLSCRLPARESRTERAVGYVSKEGPEAGGGLVGGVAARSPRPNGASLPLSSSVGMRQATQRRRLASSWVVRGPLPAGMPPCWSWSRAVQGSRWGRRSAGSPRGRPAGPPRVRSAHGAN